VTLSAGKEFSFSMPIFQGGVGALVRSDASADLLAKLTTGNRAAPAGTTFPAVGGSPTQAAATEKLRAQVTPVRATRRACRRCSSARRAYFSPIARVAGCRTTQRRYTTAPVAIALKRGSDDARLAVDRALSRLYREGEWRAIYVKWFGEPDPETIAFFRLSVLPE
jgi:putrescine:ornithine antiporter